VEHSLYFSTMDYMGRPCVIVKKSNVVGHLHDYPFQVSYDFSAQGLMIEPLYAVGVIFICYLVAIIFGRLDLRFKDEDKKKNA